jgi:hypothetical protein
MSLIDENCLFSGEAKFESKSGAEAYLKLYKSRMNKKLNAIDKTKNRERNTKYLSWAIWQLTSSKKRNMDQQHIYISLSALS